MIHFLYSTESIIYIQFFSESLTRTKASRFGFPWPDLSPLRANKFAWFRIFPVDFNWESLIINDWKSLTLDILNNLRAFWTFISEKKNQFFVVVKKSADAEPRDLSFHFASVKIRFYLKRSLSFIFELYWLYNFKCEIFLRQNIIFKKIYWTFFTEI